MIGFAAVPSAAVAGPTWDGGGGADATWTTASNWDSNVAPNLANGTSAIVFQTLGGGTAAAATQLGGGTVDILSLRSLNFTGATVALGTTGQTVTGFSINSGTLIVRSGSISKENIAVPVVVINSALQLVSDGRFNNEFVNDTNAGIVFVGPISEDSTSRNVVVRGNTTASGDTFSRVALGGVNTYTGSTTVERGKLLVGLLSSNTTANAGISAAPGVAGALGNSTSDVVVGNATTAANNWSVALEIGNGVNMSRGIRFANTGTGVARFETSAVGLRSSTLTLDRTISWHAFGANQSWTGLVTGTGGFTKTGEVLRLTNTANDFTGSVSLLQTGLSFDVSGTNNALGRGTSDIQITAAGANTNNGRTLTAIGSGTVSRGINVQATATQPVNITTTGTVEFSGNIVLNSLGGNVGLDAGGTQLSRFTGVISGSAPVITSGNASSNGSQVVLTNPNSSFSGQVRVGNGGLFIGGNVTAGQNGPLGNSSSSIWVGSATSGGNPSYLVTDGGYTVTRNLLVPGPSDGGNDSYTGAVLIGNATNTSAIFSGSLAINRTPGSTRQNVLFASNDGSVEFSGPISGSAAIGIGGNVTNLLAGVPDGRIGSVVLSGNNSGFSGDIAIQTRARLVVASNNALGTGTTPVAFYTYGANTSGTVVGGVSTRGAVTVSRDLLLNGTNSTISQPVSFLGTTADASVFTGRITINRGVSGGVPEQSFGAVAGGSVDFRGVITGTGVIAVPIVKTGEGLVIFSATNNYRGTTTINAGVLRGSDGVGISGSNVILAGGVWESATSVTRGLGTGANQVQLTNANSGSSGFSSANAAGMTVAIGGTAAPTALTWGDFGFTMNTLVLNAPTAAGTLEFRNSINLNADARTISVGANRATVSGTISNGALVKTGAGALVLTASNSYAFGTTINAGRLEIAPTGRINASSGVTIDGVGAELRYNGSAALTAPITFTRGTISGTGTIGTAVTVAANNVISPGNSPGIQAYTSGLTMASGGSYLWEINGWNGTAGNEADGFDQIAVSGSPLVISANSGSRFTIAITGLSGTAAGVVPNFSSATTTGTSFTIATSAAGISGFAANKFTLDTSAFTNNNPLPANAGFWIGQVGNDLILNYSPSARYTLTGSAAATVIRTTGSTTLTATITSATTAVTNPDSLGYRGLALSGAGALSSTSGTIAGGASGSGSVSFSSGSAGVFTFTPSITSGTNVNVGTAAIASATSGVSVTVYNPAAANTLTGSSFGTVLRDTALAQTLLITNTAAPGGFTERLDASFGSLSSLATTNSGSISLLAAGSTSTAMVVYLSTAAAGLASGTAQVSFTSNGDGTSGLAPLALTPQTVILSATVLDPAVASFSNGAQASLLIDFGSVMQLSAGPTEGFEIWNLLQTAGYTADLALLSFSETGDTSVLTTDLPASFTDLGPNGYFSYMASFADTSTLGAFESIYTLRFKSANGGVVFEGDSEQILTLTLKGVIVVPEPASVVLAAAGLAGLAALRRRRPVRARDDR